jgi:HPt (histidine-containing phosphotransfer) domain-containing protein
LDHDRLPEHLTQLPARDHVAALAVAGGDAELAAELFAALLTGLPNEVAALRSGVVGGDWSALAELAHRVRGATRYCGVPALDEAVESLERTARIGEAERIAKAMEHLESEAERLRQSAT